MDVAVSNEPSEHRYEARIDDELAGFLQYRERQGLIAFIHTEVDDRFEGQGVGGTVVGGALEDVRARGLAVLPFCPFVGKYIQRHPDFAELVPADHRERFGL